MNFFSFNMFIGEKNHDIGKCSGTARHLLCSPGTRWRRSTHTTTHTRTDMTTLWLNRPSGADSVKICISTPVIVWIFVVKYKIEFGLMRNLNVLSGRGFWSHWNSFNNYTTTLCVVSIKLCHFYLYTNHEKKYLSSCTDNKRSQITRLSLPISKSNLTWPYLLNQSKNFKTIHDFDDLSIGNKFSDNYLLGLHATISLVSNNLENWKDCKYLVCHCGLLSNCAVSLMDQWGFKTRPGDLVMPDPIG